MRRSYFFLEILRKAIALLSFGCCIALGGLSLGMFDTTLGKAVVSKFSLWYSALPENQTRNLMNAT